MENQNGYFSRKLRAGKRRTYFFDVRSTKQGDYFVTITESKRRFDRTGYDSHKIFLYKEDFKNFSESLEETINHIKTELNPDFDYDNYNREVYQEQESDHDKEHQNEDVSIEEKLKNDQVLHRENKKSILDQEEKDDVSPNDEAMQW